MTSLLEMLFFAGKYTGSPREGTIASEMRAAWARFKLAHKRCKENENNLRAEALVFKIREAKGVLFWHNVKRTNDTKNKLSARIDEAMNEKDVASLWKNKFCSVLNQVDV